MATGKLIVILGSGPGIGAATGSIFASKGFNVALLSRNAGRLDEDAARIRQANSKSKVVAYPVDLGDHDALSKTLAKVEAEMGAPEVVYYNAARVAPSKPGQTGPEDILGDFKSMSLGLFVAASWAIPHLTAAANKQDTHPTLMFTNSPLWDRPLADFTSLSMQKAAQYNLMQSLKQILEPQGVHVGGVSIAGMVNDGEPVINAKNIAQTLFELSQQEKKDWQWEIMLGDWDAFLKKMSGQ